MEVNFVRMIPIGSAILLLFSLLFFSLLSVAIWDVNNIINNYIYNNTATLVKLKSINDTFPFIGKVRVCLYYQMPLFTDWQNYHYSVPGYDEAVEGQVLQTIDDHYVGHIGEHEWGSEDNDPRLLPQFSGYIQLLDKMGPKLLNITQYRNQINRSDVLSAVDTFLTTPNITDKIKEIWLKDNGWSLEGMRGEPSSIRDVEVGVGAEAIEMDKVGRQHVCFNLPLGDYLKKGQRIEYWMNFVTRNASLGLPNNGPPPRIAEVQIFYPHDTRMYKGERKANISYDVFEVTITNSAVIDRTGFYKCTSTHETEEECLEQEKLKTIGRVCGCTPFTIALKAALSLNEANTSKGPTRNNYCTTDIYEKCWDEANEEATKVERATRQEGKCVPCQVSKNNFRVTKSTHKELVVEEFKPWHPLSLMDFECTDKDYFYFQEQEQNSRSQLVSQIGGDLGLYIGFSMVSMVHLCLFIYHMQRHHSECDCGLQYSNKYKRWFRFAMCYIFRTLEIANVRCATAKEKANYQQITDRVQRLEAEKKEMLKNMDIEKKQMMANMESMIASLRKEMLEQKEALENNEAMAHSAVRL